MTPPIPATSSARLGLQWSLDRFARAASRIARAGLADPLAAPAPGAAPPAGAAAPADARDDVDLAGSMVDVLLAQRAFAANLRVLEAAGDMAREATRLGRRGTGD